MAGGVAGVLFSDGRLVEAKLLDKLEANLDSRTVDGEAIGAAFLHGLLNTCREVAWNNNRIAEVLERRLAVWDEDEFMRALPSLRLAFANLTTRETDRVARVVAGLRGESSLGPLRHRDISEADLLRGINLNKSLRESLRQDNLDEWAAS